MKTGLFRDSFLEDPWRDLVPRKRGLQSGLETTPLTNAPRTVGIGQGQAKDPKDVGMGSEDAEGEIALPDSDEEDLNEAAQDSSIGLGDGLVEAVRNISN